jgi:hypothetical protein
MAGEAGQSLGSAMKTPSFGRRAFLGWAALTVSAPLCRAIEEIRRVGPPRLKLSLAAYSFRDFFRAQPGGKEGKPPAGREMDMPGFLDFCAGHGCDGAEITSYYMCPIARDGGLSPESSKRHAFLRGVGGERDRGGQHVHPAERRTKGARDCVGQAVD